jgi:hypothetical protein
LPTDRRARLLYSNGQTVLEDAQMLLTILARRATEVRALLDAGKFAGTRVTLRNGGTLPAELFAKVALDDLTRLRGLGQPDTRVSDDSPWLRLVADIELLHEVALQPA